MAQSRRGWGSGMTDLARPSALAAWALAGALIGGEAGAAPPAGAATPSRAEASAEAEARAHFKRGGAYFDRQEWRAALGEFRQTLALNKNRAAMVNAAACLKALEQYDEALDLYEQVRREFPGLPSLVEAKVASAITELAGLVGTVVVTGDTPAGASVFIDDRLRGRLPLEAPLRVGAGNHAVRVEREGYEPIAATVIAKARQENVVELRARSRKGRLRVNEKHGWALQVEVDGKDVGPSPWQGLVDVGGHQVRLHGLVSVEAIAACEVAPAASSEGKRGEARLGSKTAAATVKLYQEATVVLDAEEQDASLHIDSTPVGATLTIDAREVGKTPWEGRLDLGDHAIELRTAGFVPVTQTVRLEPRKQRELTLRLEPESDRTRTARNVGAGVAFGVGVVGFGVFGVTGGLALAQRNQIRSTCGGNVCPGDQQSNVDTARSLGTASTVGLVVGVVGAAAGTVVLLTVRPKSEHRTGGAALKAGVGAGRFELGGTF
jgi:PEGA domain